MDLAQLGSSGRKVTPLGLGMAALGRPGYITLGHEADLKGDYAITQMEAHAHAVLDAAWQAGIRYFDIARSYGRGEAFLASWLESRTIAPTEITVGSKWGYTYTANWQVQAEKHEVKEHSLAVLQRQTAVSQQLLGNYLNLYQVHSATLSSRVLQNTAVLTQLAHLKANGVLIGLSLSGDKQAETLAKALEVRVDGEPLFGAVQATWNLLEPSAGKMLQAAYEAGWGVIVKEAVANGRLTSRNDSPNFASQRQLLDEVAKEKNTAIDALALAGVLAQPWASVVLSGAATVAQLRSNVQAINVVWDEETAVQLSPLIETPKIYWQTRSQLAWN